MLDTFNAVWTALTTTNEELIKVILIPCNFVEVTFSRQMPLDTSPYSEPYVQFSRIRLLVITFTFNQTS